MLIIRINSCWLNTALWMCWKSCNSRLTGPLSHLFCNMFGFFLISFKIRNVDRRAKGKYGIFKIHIYWQPDSEPHLCLQGVIPPAVNALHLHLQPEGTSPHPRINLCHIFVKHKSPQTRYPQITLLSGYKNWNIGPSYLTVVILNVFSYVYKCVNMALNYL